MEKNVPEDHFLPLFDFRTVLKQIFSIFKHGHIDIL